MKSCLSIKVKIEFVSVGLGGRGKSALKHLYTSCDPVSIQGLLGKFNTTYTETALGLQRATHSETSTQSQTSGSIP